MPDEALRDAAGTLHAAAPDARIVSLVPSITELLFDLGLGDRVVGRTGFCVHPRPAVRDVPKVGGTKDVKLDALRALAPTHVIVNVDENEASTVDELRRFVPHIVVTHPNAPGDNLALYALLGGMFYIPGQRRGYGDSHRGGHGLTDMRKSTYASVNTYYYKLALDMGMDQFDRYLGGYGFGRPTGVDLLGEIGGILPSPQWKREHVKPDGRWYSGDTVISGIGQGFWKVTPLQLAHAGAMLAARGKNFRPRLLIGTENAVSREVQMLDPIELTGLEGVAPEHWQTVHEAMVGVTTELHGTARTAMRGAAYVAAGKTGTAQVFTIAQDEEYDEELLDERLRDHRWFFAYAPAEAPTIAIAVIVENGGSTIPAVPVARAVLDAYFESQNYVAWNP